MKQLKSCDPSGKVLLDILKVADKHKLDDFDFENELMIALNIIREMRNKFGSAADASYCVSKSLKDPS